MKLEPYKEQIIDEYVNKGYTTTQIAEHISASQTGVERLLKRNNVEMHRTEFIKVIPVEKYQEIIEKYENGATTCELGIEYGVADSTIAKVIKNSGGTVRKAIRRSCVKRHDYFNTIDSPEKAYFLGWMITDGSVVRAITRSDRSLIIALLLKEDDRYIIEEFAKELCAPIEKVRHSKSRNQSYFRFTSEEMSEDLSKYGVVPNKTWTSYLPIIRDDLMPYLIRGIFDGNGTVTIDKKDGSLRFGLFGTEKLCTQVRDYLHNKIDLHLSKVSRQNEKEQEGCYHIWWGSKKDNMDFYNYIYNNEYEFCLKRKKEKFEKWLAMQAA